MKNSFVTYLLEGVDIKEKRAEAIKISSSKSQKIERFDFEFRFYEFKLNPGNFPIHPSADLNSTFELIVTTNKDNLETIFTYNCDLIDRIDYSGKVYTRFEVKDLKDFKCFTDDEEVKLDKGTAKKISTALKIDSKMIKQEFEKSFDVEKMTNYPKILKQIEEINAKNSGVEKMEGMFGASDEIEKISKKYGTTAQKIILHKNIAFLSSGNLNSMMREKIKSNLESFETELWSINDRKNRVKAEEKNEEILKNISNISKGKLIYKSKNEEIIKEI